MRLGHDAASRSARVVFAILMMYAWSGGVVMNARQSAMAAPVDRERLAGEMEKQFAQLEKVARDLPRDSFDPKAVVASVGSEPEKLFQWVRDQTRWTPYRGALRGATGVLMDRVGSSLDRALLLAGLLQAAGHPVRLANAELSDAAAKALLQKAWNDATTLPAPGGAGGSPPPNGKSFDDYCRDVGADPAEVKKQVDAAVRRGGESAGEMSKRIEMQLPMLTSAVAAGDSGRSDEQRDALAAMRDHWWVQRDAGGKWIDMDPTDPQGAPGVAPAPANRTVALDKLDAADHQQVQIEIVIESSDGKRLTEHSILKHAVRATDVVGQGISLTHAPLDWPKDHLLAASGGAMDDRATRQTVQEQKRWAPMLRVGGQFVVQKGFSESGEVIETPGSGMVAGTGQGAQAVGGDVGSILGGRRIGDRDKGKASSTRLTAEWIDYEIRVPGKSAQRIRRPLLDVIGPAARAQRQLDSKLMTADDAQRLEMNLTLLGRTDVAVQCCKLSPAFLHHRGAAVMLGQRKALVDLLRGPADGGKAMLAAATALGDLPGAAEVLALARFQASGVAADLYLDCPNVLNHRVQYTAQPDGTLGLWELYDIVNNEVGVRPGARGRATRLQQGLADSVAEGRLLTGGFRGALSATEVFASAAAQGVESLTLRAPKDATSSDLAALPDVRQRIDDALKRGQVVVVPKRPVTMAGGERLAWWCIDPQSGHALGVIDSGYHGAGTEKPGTEAVTEEELFRRIAPFINNGNVRAQEALIELTLRAGGGSGGSIALGVEELAAGILGLLALGVYAGSQIANSGGSGSGGQAAPQPSPSPTP